MTNRQSENEMKEELLTARILSVFFISFMILIVSSYSDIPETETHQIISAKTIVNSMDGIKTSVKTPTLINTRLNPTLGRIKLN